MNTLKTLAPAALVLALLFLGDSLLTQNVAYAAGSSSKTTDTRRVFYLTRDAFTGAQALTACTTGFHMASIWEINDTTVLRYDSTLGRTNGDSGPGGPPANEDTALGWIRTGGGHPSCQDWTSSSSTDFGTVGAPILDANTGPRWFVADTLSCDISQADLGVWCVRD